MHFSAKRGFARSCLSVRPSVRLSVTLVDCNHIGWKSWKLIARTISPTFEAKRRSTYSQRNMGKFWGDYRVEKKWRAGEQKRQYLRNAYGKDRSKITVDGL